MAPSHTLPRQICQPKRRRQSPLCPICQRQKRKRRRHPRRLLKGRPMEANYLRGILRNPKNVTDMPMLLPFSFTPTFTNLNTNVCLFIHNNGKPSTNWSPYTNEMHHHKNPRISIYFYLLFYPWHTSKPTNLHLPISSHMPWHTNQNPRISIYPSVHMYWISSITHANIFNT